MFPLNSNQVFHHMVITLDTSFPIAGLKYIIIFLEKIFSPLSLLCSLQQFFIFEAK